MLAEVMLELPPVLTLTLEIVTYADEAQMP
jgi:hypothetical protein